MNYTLPKLLAWVDQSLAPAELISSELIPADFDNWNTLIKLENLEWRSHMSSYLLGITNNIQKKQFLTAQQQQAVALSNQVNQYLYRNYRLWSSSPHAAQIKILYQSLLSSFEKLLIYIEQRFPDHYDPTVKISDFKLQEVLPNLRNAINRFNLILNNSDIDSELSKLVIKGIKGVSAPGKLSHANYRYIKHLIWETENLNDLKHRAFVDLLIRLDFNQPEFYLYLTNAMDLKLQQIDGLHEELEYIIQRKEDLNDKLIKPCYRLYQEELSLKHELHLFFGEKIVYLEKLLSHRRRTMQDRFDAEDAFRMLIDIPVPVFALFIRMLKDTQFILKTGITEICTFFAIHFYTDKAPFISSSNLLKRTTDVEFTTVLKLWDLLSAMLDWLDVKFNVRNMKRSTR